MEQIIAKKDFPEDLANTVKNLDASLQEMENIVDELISTPLPTTVRVE